MNYRKLLVNIGLGALIAVPMTLVNAEVARGNRRVLTIHNHTGTEIAELYISHVSSPIWEKPDVLRYRSPLEPDGTLPVDITFEEGMCHYDILAKDRNGNEVPMGGVGNFDLCKYDRIALTPTSETIVVYRPGREP